MAKSGKSKESEEGEDSDLLKHAQCTNQNTKEDTACVISKSIHVTTPVSILIESLVKHLCSVYEKDNKKADFVYNFICDKLFKMNLLDESYNMNEFEGIRSQYQKAFYHLLSSALGDGKTIPMHPIWPDSGMISSHYQHEFDEEEYIAGGGFGQVYRVKHKLDGTEYAIKKIPIRSEGIESVKNYLSEVKTFASLNHSNIVQYKAAWLELGAPKTDKAIMDNFSASESSGSEVFTEEHSTSSQSLKLRKQASSDFEVSFGSASVIEKHYCHSNDHLIDNGAKRAKRQKRNSISEGGNAICTLDFHQLQQLRVHPKEQPKWATLYIQMALCQSTLKQWLEKRNLSDEALCREKETALIPINGKVREDTIMEILRQLLRGVEYIHSKGIVHHDIKPSNIFIQLENGTLLVQLGDFGLACPLQSVRHSLAFGTKLYAAPEQLAGKCDPKSDMYSLGIVLYELVEMFRTDMERVRNITELRRGNLAPHLHLEHPQFARIIMQLVCRNPQDRLNASDLLKRITVTVTESERVKELELQLAEKDEEILRLKELLKNASIKSI